ncbi:MAG TPA: SAM-dependent methyltransferase, partial [Chloroflexota bacterium]|nr:SAM-dependent methyltransferase [Chloroflexota bacterium]
RQLPASALSALLDQYAAGSFAGAYSSFGPLNCEPELEDVAAALHSLIRPGGRVVISAINRFHPFEFLWYAAHGDLGRAVRRWGGYAEGTVSPTLPDRVPTYYYTPRAFARRFQPYFQLVRCRALLLFLPPPYLEHLTRRFPRLFQLAARLDRQVASWPLLRALGDHFYIELERR